MGKKSIQTKSWYIPVLMLLSAFLMYILAILPILVSRGLPFFYYGDYNVQQIPFYILAHRAVRSGQTLWSWNIDLGSSIPGAFSFYLWGSPFFWLTIPFPEQAIPYLMPLLMALKYAISAMCAYLYIRRYVNKYVYAMAGGYLYAFSGFNACNIVFNHFTDSVAFFPLYLLLFERLMEIGDTTVPVLKNTRHVSGNVTPNIAKKKLKSDGLIRYISFVWMTSVMSVINYYFFFGQIVFFIIYFVVRYTRGGSLRSTAKLAGRFVAGAVNGVLISGAFLMQAYAGVAGNSRLDNFLTGYNMLVYPSGKLWWDILKSLSMLPDIIGKGTLFYTGTVKNASLAVYIPMFGLAGVIAFFLFYKRKKRWEKTLIITCLVIAAVPILNSAFSLFNSGYYARWFYMPILIMCLMTAKILEKGKTQQLKRGTVAAVSLFLLFVVIYFLPSTDDFGNIVWLNMADNNTIFLIDVLGTAILCLMLLILIFVIPRRFGDADRKLQKKTGFKLYEGIMLGFVIISCIIATFIPVRNGSTIIVQRGKLKWQEQMLENRVEVDLTKFARGEVDGTSTNYDMVWGVPSLHCFLSTVPSEIFDFLKGAGGINRTVETNIPMDRVGMRAILSGRYYFENAEISKNRVFYNGEGTDGYVYSGTQNGFDVFENLNYIPMGFAYDYYITESEWEDLDAAKHDYDLARVLILSDDDVLNYGDSLDMTELTAEDIQDNKLSYADFVKECSSRAMSSCSEFTASDKGFTATTSILAGNKLIFFSVPDRKGFSCTVDGRATEIIKADYGLMAIPVSGGVHKIEVNYTPDGLREGVIMSVIGVLILLTITICYVIFSNDKLIFIKER